MAFDGALTDYIDVAERIQAFYSKYPDGSLTQVEMQFVNVAGKDWVVYTAAAFRSPEDQHPGIGTAWEPIPGATNFTRNSEVQNAETAAWGRAIVAVGLASSSKIASRQEVEARQADRAAAERLTVIKKEIAKRMGSGVTGEEIKRRVNEFLRMPEGYSGEYDAADLESFLASLPGPSAQERVNRAFATEPPTASPDEIPAPTTPQESQP